MISTPWKFCSCIQELKHTISFLHIGTFRCFRGFFTFYDLHDNLTEISGTFKYIRSPSLKICHFEFRLRQLKTKFVPILPNITFPGEWRLCFSSLYIFSLIYLTRVNSCEGITEFYWYDYANPSINLCDHSNQASERTETVWNR